jgi:hypothetical protein
MDDQSPFFHYWNSISNYPTYDCYGILFCEETEKRFIGWFDTTSKSWSIIIRGHKNNQELSSNIQELFGIKLTHWIELGKIPRPQEANLVTKSDFLHEVIAAILECC